MRLGSPVLLRQLLRGLVLYASGGMEEGQTGMQLWLWAALLACTGYLMVRHEYFDDWFGVVMDGSLCEQCVCSVT